MRSRLVIAVNGSSSDQRDAISEFIRGTEGVNWWHWFQELWLIIDPEGREAAWWRNELAEVAPGIELLVLEQEGKVRWSAFSRRSTVERAKKRGQNSPFDWLKTKKFQLPEE